MFKLNTTVTDSASGLAGRLTHMNMEIGGHRRYAFQPAGLDLKTGKPHAAKWISPERVRGGEVIADPRMPEHALGTLVRHPHSGFAGTVVFLCLHASGCIHADVQPLGQDPADGGFRDLHDFDLRELEGDVLPSWSEQEKTKDRSQRPSPMPAPDRADR